MALLLDQGAHSMSMGWRWTSLPSPARRLLCAALGNLLSQLAYGGAVASAHQTPFTLMLVISSQSLKPEARGSLAI